MAETKREAEADDFLADYDDLEDCLDDEMETAEASVDWDDFSSD